jgi:hypothetical protein
MDAPAPPPAAPGAPEPGPHPWRRRAAVTAAGVVTVLAVLRPTPERLARRLPNLGDPALIIWITEWGRRALVHRPAPLFDAPAFWPHPRTLAYSENLLAAQVVTAPLRALGAGWVLTYNLLVAACLAFAFAATYTLARHVVGRADAAVLAAVAFTASGYVVAHLGHAQLLLVGGFPLGLWFTLRLLEERRWWQAAGVGSILPLFTYFALYYAAIWTVILPVVLATDLFRRRLRWDRRTWGLVAVAAVISVLGAAPGAGEYRRLQQEADFERALAPEWGLDATDLVTPAAGAYVWRPLDRAFADRADRWEHTFFPGVLTLVLAVVGAVAALGRAPGSARDAEGARVRRGRLLLVGVAGAASFAVALGPQVRGIELTPFRLLYDHVPGFNGVRVAARLAVPGLLSLCVLAAAGFAALTARARPGARHLAAVAAVGFLLVELAAPVPGAPLPTDAGTLAAYRALAGLPAGAVVHLPMPDPAEGARWATLEGPRLVYATIDWHPRLNGYSGSWPEPYRDDAATLARLPAPEARARLAQRCVRYVVLHTGSFAGQPQLPEPVADRIVRALAADGARVVHRGRDRVVDLGPVSPGCPGDARARAAGPGRLQGP